MSIKCGIIGCGVVAPSHIQAYQACDEVEVTWACDLIKEKAENVAQKYQIPHVTTAYQDVLNNDVDCISVCTDHASHAIISVDALKAGVHVLCEKALAGTHDDLDIMCDTHAAYQDTMFAGVFQHRFDFPVRYMKKLVDDGAFGHILTASVHHRCLRTNEYYTADAWRGTWAKEGGAVLINQAIHFIDALVWIMGGVEKVYGRYANMTHNGVIETEDTAVACLEFTKGAMGTIEATSSSHIEWEYTLCIHGDAGSLEMRNDTPLKVAFSDTRITEAVQSDLTQAPGRERHPSVKTYYGTGHQPQIKDFIDAQREGRLPFVTAESARHTVDVVLAIYEAHRRNASVSVKQLQEK